MRKNHKKKIIHKREIYIFMVFMWIFLFYVPITFAQSDDFDYLYSLSLEELLNVTIGSKKSESFIDAPGVVTIVNRQQIQQYGARNLRDVLDRLVNMQVIGSNLYPHNRLAIRGVTQTHTDNKILLLLNGRVIRDANQGGINTDIYNLFPVSLIEKIEIIRGPGSTLYGTNAFSGIVNLITKNSDESGSSVELTLGSFSTKAFTGNYTIVGSEYHANVAINTIESTGDIFKDINGEFGTSGNYPMDKKATQLLFNGHYNDFEINALLSDSKLGNVKSLFQFPSSELETQRIHVDFGHNYSLNDTWQLKTNFTYNYHQIAFDISNTRATRTDSQDYLWDINIAGKLTEASHLIFGMTHESLNGTIGNQSITPTPFDTYRVGAYAQIEWELDESDKLVIGVQINKAEFSDRYISPRLAFIHKINSKWTSKFLYGEAFRSPFATDMFLNSPSLKGNPDLLPETIETYDAQLIYYDNKLYFSAAVYHSVHKDLHQREVIDTVPTFVNKGEVTYNGVELEFRKQLLKNSEITLNASYQKNEDQNGMEDITFNPNLMIKAGFSHDLDNGISISIFDSYFSQPTQLTELGFTPEAINDKSESYHLVSSNIRIEFEKLFSDVRWKNLSANFYMDNLLDETIYFPSINRTNVSTLPHHSGRNFQLNFNYRF